MSHRAVFLGDRGAEVCVIRLMSRAGDDTEEEYSRLRACFGRPLAYIGAIFDGGDDSFSPWPAPTVFKGGEDFAGGGAETLNILLNEMIPEAKKALDLPKTVKYLIGGYSLSALFSLWAGCVSDRFYGVAAPSPSVWYPRWDSFIAATPMRAALVCLSLGDRESRTRNAVMATVADRMELQYKALQSQIGDENVVFSWTKGNHFADVPQRVYAAFEWLLNRCK